MTTDFPDLSVPSKAMSQMAKNVEKPPYPIISPFAFDLLRLWGRGAFAFDVFLLSFALPVRFLVFMDLITNHAADITHHEGPLSSLSTIAL